MSHDPNEERNAAERRIALDIMKALNDGPLMCASIPRTRDGIVSFDVEPFDGSSEFTVIVSRNDRASS